MNKKRAKQIKDLMLSQSVMLETTFLKTADGDLKIFEVSIVNLPDGVPCKHPGCLQHVSHPCEGCGRIAGRKVTQEDQNEESGGAKHVTEHDDQVVSFVYAGQYLRPSKK